MVKDGTAQGVYQVFKQILADSDIEITKVLGMGTDGAAVMTGHFSGVTALIHEDNPFCVSVHCVCHRLNLAVSQSCKDIAEMQTLTTIVSTIYNYISQSSKRAAKLKDLNEILGEKNIKLKRIFEIRWLSMGDAILAIIRNYEALLILTSNEAAQGDPIAIGLHGQLSSYMYLALMHLASDILAEINHLSKIFQFRDVCFGTLGQSLNDTIRSLQDMHEQNSTQTDILENELAAEPVGYFKGTQVIYAAEGRGQRRDQRQRFAQVKEELLDHLVENIQARFPQVDIFTAMQIFEPRSYPAVEEHNLLSWGNQHLQTVLNFYGKEKTNQDGQRFPPMVDITECCAEFLPFKRLVMRNKGEQRLDNNGNQYFHYFRPPELMQKLFGNEMRQNQEIYPAIFRLMCCCLCILVGNAEAERVFSCQNRIKSKARTLLSVDQLDKLIRISYAKIPIEQFDFAAAAQLFLGGRPRRI